MLQAYHTIRLGLSGAVAIPGTGNVAGSLHANTDNIKLLQRLQNDGHIQGATHNSTAVDFTSLEEAGIPSAGLLVSLTLVPGILPYFESIDDLIHYSSEEPAIYFIRSLGEIRSDQTAIPNSISLYREMRRAWRLLQGTADLSKPDRAIFLAPEKLEIPFICFESDLRSLTELPELEIQLATGTVERDQRIILFKRSLREHLRAHPVEDHFRCLLQNFSSIYDSYHRDYELWLGTTFGEIEKSFEEKRLKFITDLNGILSGIQASILAVPITALLVVDKFDSSNPLKNLFLIITIWIVGAISLRLLHNQEHTLEATSDAIVAVKNDFEKKHTKRRQEFVSRLNSVCKQEERVRKLLDHLRIVIILILVVVSCVFLGSLVWRFASETTKHTFVEVRSGSF